MFPETIPTSASKVLTTFAKDDANNNTNAPILRARFNHNGEYAILCKDRSLFLLNPRTNLCLKEYSGVHAREVRDGCASRDNSKLVSCGGDRGTRRRRRRGHFLVVRSRRFCRLRVSDDSFSSAFLSFLSVRVCVCV